MPKVKIYLQPWFIWIVAILLLLVSFVSHLLVGSMTIHLSDLLGQPHSMAQQVFWELRLPRAIAGVLVGAALAGSGSVLQTVLHNPLAEPGLLGISSGASLFALLTMVLSAAFGINLPIWGSAFAAFLGAFSVALLLFFMARRYQFSSATLLLFGVVIGILASAGLTWCIYFSANQDLRQLLYWLMGSLSFAYGQVWFILPLFIVTCGALFFDSRYLNWLLLGEPYAFSMGVDIRRIRPRLILWVSLLSAMSVACAGTISFVGLLVPHVLRRLLGDEQRQLLGLSMLFGGSVVLLADSLARTLLPNAELPLGVIMATLGAPILFWILLRRPDAAY